MIASRRVYSANLALGSVLMLVAIYIALDTPVRAQTEGPTCGGVSMPSSSGGQNWQCCDNSTWYDANTEGCCCGSYYTLATQACCYAAGTYFNTATQGCCMEAAQIYYRATQCCCIDEVDSL